jgi:hypothetical protein
MDIQRLAPSSRPGHRDPDHGPQRPGDPGITDRAYIISAGRSSEAPARSPAAWPGRSISAKASAQSRALAVQQPVSTATDAAAGADATLNRRQTAAVLAPGAGAVHPPGVARKPDPRGVAEEPIGQPPRPAAVAAPGGGALPDSDDELDPVRRATTVVRAARRLEEPGYGSASRAPGSPTTSAAAERRRDDEETA